MALAHPGVLSGVGDCIRASTQHNPKGGLYTERRVTGAPQAVPWASLALRLSNWKWSPASPRPLPLPPIYRPVKNSRVLGCGKLVLGSKLEHFLIRARPPTKCHATAGARETSTQPGLSGCSPGGGNIANTQVRAQQGTSLLILRASWMWRVDLAIHVFFSS